METTAHYFPPYSPKLEMWYNAAYKEKNIEISNINKAYAILPKSFYGKVNTYNQLNINKIYNFCFIGLMYIDHETIINRSWILTFIKEKFNNDSYLQFTDSKTKINYEVLGNFDYTLLKNGFVPKETPNILDRNFFDEIYYSNMCKSKFCLCPAGDAKWSMRFIEAIMCKTIPIVNEVEESYRSDEESKLDYKYYLSSDKEFIFREDWVQHNYNIFLKHHTLEFL